MSFSKNGFEILNDILTTEELSTIKLDLESSFVHTLTAGIRNADKKFPSIKSLVTSNKLLRIAKNYLNGNPSLVRVILFDKTPNNNWLVTWHQDKTICVSEKKEIEGWGPWTLKDKIHHVLPPLEVLNQMVTLRIHLDDSTIDRGCLRVVPGSHLLGILSNTQIQDATTTETAVNCEGRAGSILAIKPHLLHASSKAITPNQRRVIHAEYSCYNLPKGLAWA